MKCVYCLETRELDDRQILLRGEDLYLCAPRGQLVEGYLAIAPYTCIGSISHMPPGYFAELSRFIGVVKDFYRKAYGTRQATFYEQGRAGGGASVDQASGFPLHAHLCALPLQIPMHAVLAQNYVPQAVSDFHELRTIVFDQPYVYVDAMDAKVVYVAPVGERRAELERTRLKPVIAELIGLPERGYWRDYPGDGELAQLIDRWRLLRGRQITTRKMN
jgi:diadenosine tetraphosphate (Ap4A) HIT family hydrolase